MEVTHTHAKDQGQKSVTSKNRVKMDGQTDGDNCVTSHANTVNNKLSIFQ